jgi:hypothetical protein
MEQVGKVAFHVLSIDRTDVVGNLNMVASFQPFGGSLTTNVTDVHNPTSPFPLFYSDFTDNGTGLIAGDIFSTSVVGTLNSSTVSVLLHGNFRGDGAETVYGNNLLATLYGNRQ